METEGSLPHSQVPATCSYREPDRSSPYPLNPTSWRSILILSSHLRLGPPSRFFPSSFPTKTLYTTLFSPIRATWPAHLIPLDFITRTILGEECRSLSSSLFCFLHSLLTSSLLGPNILLNTLFSNTFSLHSSFNVSDQVSHPYKTKGKIIVLYILIVSFSYLSKNQYMCYRLSISVVCHLKTILTSSCTQYFTTSTSMTLWFPTLYSVAHTTSILQRTFSCSVNCSLTNYTDTPFFRRADESK